MPSSSNALKLSAVKNYKYKTELYCYFTNLSLEDFAIILLCGDHIQPPVNGLSSVVKPCAGISWNMIWEFRYTKLSSNRQSRQSRLWPSNTVMFLVLTAAYHILIIWCRTPQET